MENQLIEFEGEKITLPKGFHWEIHRYFTSSGSIRKHKDLPFKKFTRAIHKWQDGNFHLFELRCGTMRCMAYCVIKYDK